MVAAEESGEEIRRGVGEGRQRSNERCYESSQTQQRSSGGTWSRARQRARNSLTEEQEEHAGYDDGDHHRSLSALAHDDVGNETRRQGDSDRLHKL